MYGNRVETASCPFPHIVLLFNHHHLISHQKNSVGHFSSFHIWHQDEMPADIIISLHIKVPSTEKNFFPKHFTSRFFSTIVISLRETCHQSSFSRNQFQYFTSRLNACSIIFISLHIKVPSADRHFYLWYQNEMPSFHSSSSFFLSKILRQLNISIFNICHQDEMQTSLSVFSS